MKLSKEKYEEKFKEINTFRPKMNNNSFTKYFSKKINPSLKDKGIFWKKKLKFLKK
jgi:hypothetical protein